jgi:hypothetical protein
MERNQLHDFENEQFAATIVSYCMANEVDAVYLEWVYDYRQYEATFLLPASQDDLEQELAAILTSDYLALRIGIPAIETYIDVPEAESPQDDFTAFFSDFIAQD